MNLRAGRSCLEVVAYQSSVLNVLELFDDRLSGHQRRLASGSRQHLRRLMFTIPSIAFTVGTDNENSTTYGNDGTWRFATILEASRLRLPLLSLPHPWPLS